MLREGGVAYAVQKTCLREDADPTEDREHALEVLALECALAQHKGWVVPLPASLLELFAEEWWCEYDWGWERWERAGGEWYLLRDSSVTLEEFWESILGSPPETFLGGHSGMTRTNLFRRSRAA